MLTGKGLVIFDFDGVIADSEVISLTCLQASLNAFGISLSLDEIRARFLGTSLDHVTAHVAEQQGRNAAGFAAYWETALFDHFRNDLKPVPFVTDLLNLLDDMGLPFCIASSGTFERIGVALEAMQLTHRFAHIYSAQQVQHGKPAPDLFAFAAKDCGIDPAACLVIEDSPHGVRAAKAAGMPCVGFLGGSHLQDIATDHGASLRDAGADMILSSYAGLFRP